MRFHLEGSLSPDPAVRGVERLLEPDGARRFVRDLRANGIASRSARVRAAVVKQRPGQRAVLRIEVEEGGPGDGSDADITRDEAVAVWYAKLCRSSSAWKRLYDPGLFELADRAAQAGVQVPLPVVWLPRFRALLTKYAPGTPLVGILGTETSGDTLAQFGLALGRLHLLLPLCGEARGPAFEREQILHARDRYLKDNRPELLASFDERMRDWWEQRPAELDEADRPLVCLHGDLHLRQILCRDRDEEAFPFALLDWDSVCSGDAERDVANLLAHLLLEAEAGRCPREKCYAGIRRLLHGYEAVRSLDPARTNWYLTGTLLRLAALHASPVFGPITPVPASLSPAILAATRRVETFGGGNGIEGSSARETLEKGAPSWPIGNGSGLC